MNTKNLIENNDDLRTNQEFFKLKKTKLLHINDNINREWKEILSYTRNKKFHYHWQTEETMNKNRYGSVLPIEKTRVKLFNNKTSDYINANYVDGIHNKGEKNYIATQAPLKHTVEDFWMMIIEQDVNVIVMLTKLKENGLIKADQYWPDDGSINYGEITISFNNCIEKDGYLIREMNINYKDISKTVYQFHFMEWPDHGIPSSTDSILNLVLDVQDHQNKFLKNSPIVVHCSAGIGRSGAFITIDTLIKKIKEENKETNDIDMVKLIKKIRKCRAGALTHISQYEFCYEVVSSYCKSRLNCPNKLLYDV